eukprot:c24414_g1_i1 orf=137-496(+)
MRRKACMSTNRKLHEIDLHSPTVLGCDSRSDKQPTDPASDYAVSPTELEMHLWKVLAQRQEEHLLELEKAHQLAEEKLFAKEKELQRWKEHVRSLTESSLDTTLGDDNWHRLISALPLF